LDLTPIKKWIWQTAPSPLKNIYRKQYKKKSSDNEVLKMLIETFDDPLASAWVKTRDVKYVIWQSELPDKLKKLRKCKFISGEWDTLKSYFEESTVFKSFYAHFVNKVPWEQTDYYLCLQEGHYSARVKRRGSLVEFLNVYDRIFNNIRKEGFNENHPIEILIGRDGELIRYDSSHRLAIAKILGIPLIPVRVKFIHHQAKKAIFKKGIIATNFKYYPATVVSGRSITKRKVERWNGIFYKKINTTFYPGSLNLILSEPVLLNPSKAFKFANNYLLWEGIINNVPVYFLRWKNCPFHVVEAFSQYRLRDYLLLNDGDIVTVKINSNYFLNLSFPKKTVWWLLWKKREPLFYLSDYYNKIVRKAFIIKHINNAASQYSKITKTKST
jgi:hypothetical protein